MRIVRETLGAESVLGKALQSSERQGLLDVLLVDDHPLLQLGLHSSLHELGVRSAMADVSSREALLAQVADERPTAVVLDHGLPALGDGLGLIRPILQIGCRILVLTGTDDDCLWGACLEAGASAVISKSEPFAAITESILAVLANEPVRPRQRAELLDALHSQRRESSRRMAPFNELTPREALVLQYLMEGAAPGVIATREYVSVETVRSQVKGVLRKLGATTQLEAATLAIRAGWPERSGPLGRGAS